MRRLIQLLGFDRKTYHRPHDEWTCGRAAEGCPCILGPGAKGECRATGQCEPAKKNDRWYCTRSAALGGPCTAGPTPAGECGCPVPPCSPRRNLPAQRRWIAWSAFGLAVGLVGLALLGRGFDRWAEPGPLIAAHALSVQGCSDCHVQHGLPPLSASARLERNAEHNRLCLKCHDLGPDGERPHGASAAALERRGRGAASGHRPIALALASPAAPAAGAKLACAACHQEHHGRDFDPSRLTDQQCQACHRQQFARFQSGHPEFSGYPYQRRTRLQFDHVTHWSKHFSEPRVAAGAPTSCAHCHTPAPDGSLMLVRPFAQTCAQCHEAQIEGEGQAGAKGVVFLRLPAVDLAALAAAGEPTGEWPADAEGGLTPFMRWLLANDSQAVTALRVLGTTDPANLARATPGQKAAAAQLLWRIKGLLADLVVRGQQVIVARLNPGDTATAPAGARTGQFPADALLAAQQEWLPHLLDEVAAYRRGTKPPVSPPPARARPAPVAAAAATAAGADHDDLLAGQPPAAARAPSDPDDLLADDVPPSLVHGPGTPAAAAGLALDDAEARVLTGGWYRGADGYTLNYRPSRHADPFLTAWLETTAADVTPEGRSIFRQLGADQAPGLCLKCHSVDGEGKDARVNWFTTQPNPEMRPFTRFQHSAHFLLMGDQGCSTCHVMNVASNYPKAFGVNRDPLAFESSFRPMERETCAVCHRPGEAGDSCQQCHNYHTGELARLNAQAAAFRGTAKPPPRAPAPDAFRP